MRIVVTGGAGFIGSHLVARLVTEGHEVVVLDNLFTGGRQNIADWLNCRNFEFVRHDVCEPFHVECDQLYHLACPASPLHYQRNPVRTIQTAFTGTLNALACARDAGARIVIASTSEVYGDPTEHPQRESYVGHVNPIGPRSCYDEGKRAAESLAVSWARQYRASVRIARIFNTYGPRMAEGDGRLLPNLITQALGKRPITVYGTGLQTRSFCYVDDTVDGLVRMMNAACDSGPVNIGNPDERTILSVAEYLAERYGGTIEFHGQPIDDPMQRCPDITLARQLLDWEPRMPFATGLERTIQSFAARQK